MEHSDITIIGAGVAGLAIASFSASENNSVLLIERNSSFGMETSSRSSEVIHAGIYYPKNSLKGKLCIEGNKLIYEICSKNNIPHSNCGKLIIAVNDKEAEKLPALLQTAKDNGAEGVRIVDQDEIRQIEPKVFGVAAIFCPSSGVVDSHSLMKYFETDSISKGVLFAYHSELKGIKKQSEGYILEITDTNGNNYKIHTNILINSAGLACHKVAEMAGIDIVSENYKINYLKGMYFRPSRQLEKYPKTLIYPVPPNQSMVGIHTCPDLAGGMRLGPKMVWVNDIEYSVDESFHDEFFNSTKGFLPFLDYDDLQPDMSGILPRLEKPGEPMRDFIIRDESDKGLDGLINLIGIESPGLTASPAIGKMVSKLIRGLGFGIRD